MQQCARCRIEADELREFFSESRAAEGASEGAEFERLLARLRETLLSVAARKPGPPASPALPRRSQGPREQPSRHRAPWLLALPAALLLAVGLALFLSGFPRTDAPPIPPLQPGSGAFRGEGRPHLLAPKGEQSSVPRHFSWESGGSPAGAWTFRLERVDGSLIWSAHTPDTSVLLPDSAARELHQGSRYVWSVERAEQPGARSGASFSIQP
ncbi:MAG: hypothetical protein AUH92_01645 [Acidobacteria bacterium 13_1_40CM_4_69_4]|nr:MAG: hypothetical protein AUH92_01645 [Acidobacteria bacterium 13_1_40CM_4_69_4]